MGKKTTCQRYRQGVIDGDNYARHGTDSGKTALCDHSAVNGSAQVMMGPVWHGRTGINNRINSHTPKTIFSIGSNELVQDTAHETGQMLRVILHNKTHVSKETIRV